MNAQTEATMVPFLDTLLLTQRKIIVPASFGHNPHCPYLRWPYQRCSCEDSLRQSVAVGALALTDRLVFLSGLND